MDDALSPSKRSQAFALAGIDVVALNSKLIAEHAVQRPYYEALFHQCYDMFEQIFPNAHESRMDFFESIFNPDYRPQRSLAIIGQHLQPDAALPPAPFGFSAYVAMECGINLGEFIAIDRDKRITATLDGIEYKPSSIDLRRVNDRALIQLREHLGMAPARAIASESYNPALITDQESGMNPMLRLVLLQRSALSSTTALGGRNISSIVPICYPVPEEGHHPWRGEPEWNRDYLLSVKPLDPTITPEERQEIILDYYAEYLYLFSDLDKPDQSAAYHYVAQQLDHLAKKDLPLDAFQSLVLDVISQVNDYISIDKQKLPLDDIIFREGQRPLPPDQTKPLR